MDVTTVRSSFPRPGDPSPAPPPRGHAAGADRCLLDAERAISTALAAAREAVVGCEAALAALATLGMLPETSPAPSHSDSPHDDVAWRRHLDSPPPIPRRVPFVRANGIHGSLTPREAEVLALIADGLSNKEIADRLFLSARTVERHITHIHAKLGTRSKAEATAWALRRALG
jgi:DNA-binding CsgD family transcriptional regulator